MQADTFPSEVERIADAIASLLDPDYPAQAEIVRRLKRAVKVGSSDVEKLYSIGGIWGGAGTVADVQLRNSDDNNALMRLLVELVSCFERNGIHYQGARQTAGMLRMWLRDTENPHLRDVEEDRYKPRIVRVSKPKP